MLGYASAGWFGPAEFHTEVDLTLRVHKHHLNALHRLESRHGVRFEVPDIKHVKGAMVNTFRKILQDLDNRAGIKPQDRL